MVKFRNVSNSSVNPYSSSPKAPIGYNTWKNVFHNI